MLRYLSLILMIFALCVSVMAQDSCEGGLVPRLVVEGYGRVTEGDANNVRDAANRQGNLIGQMEGGTPFRTLDGFECTGNLTWWQVEYFDGTETVIGWTAESNATDYFLDPILDENYVLFRNVSFILPESLAGAVVAEADEMNGFSFIRITLPEYEAIGVGNVAQIDIFSTDMRDNGDDFETMWEGSFDYAFNGLTAILETRPDLMTFSTGGDDLPDHSPGVANLTFAQRAYLDFGSGSGYRFLTAYAQDFVAINNGNLRYRYQGLTADGQYFVDVEFAVDAPENHRINFNRGGDFDQYYAYGDEVAAFYDAFAPETFTPSLLDLDALVASIEIR